MKVSFYAGEPQLNQQRLVFCQRVQSLSMMPFVTLVDMCGSDNQEVTDNMGTCQLVKVPGVSAQALGVNLSNLERV